MSESKPYTIHALELGPMENFVYLIQDDATGRAAVVDPAWEVPEVLRLAEQRGLRITDILLTHSHHDHVNGIETLLEAGEARIHLLKAEAQFWERYLDRWTMLNTIRTAASVAATLTFTIGLMQGGNA